MIGAGGIFTGIPYRIFFRDFPNAPLTYRETNFRADQLIAERRSAEWPKYEYWILSELDKRKMSQFGELILLFFKQNWRIP